MLNDTMRSDLLQYVHKGIVASKERQDGKSPLLMLIGSIEAVLEVFADTRFLAVVGPNPYNREASARRFDPVPDARHDLRLLDFQLQALRAI